MRYAVVIEKGADSYGAYVPDLPGCVATGGTREEVVALIQEAIELHIETLKKDGQPVPAPSTTKFPPGWDESRVQRVLEGEEVFKYSNAYTLCIEALYCLCCHHGSIRERLAELNPEFLNLRPESFPDVGALRRESVELQAALRALELEVANAQPSPEALEDAAQRIWSLHRDFAMYMNDVPLLSDPELWDAEILRDVEEGKLDRAMDEAREEHRAGRSRNL